MLHLDALPRWRSPPCAPVPFPFPFLLLILCMQEKKKRKPAKPILRSYSQAKMSTMDELKGASIKDIIRHKSVRKTKPTLDSVAGLLKDVLKEVGTLKVLMFALFPSSATPALLFVPLRLPCQRVPLPCGPRPPTSDDATRTRLAFPRARCVHALRASRVVRVSRRYRSSETTSTPTTSGSCLTTTHVSAAAANLRSLIPPACPVPLPMPS